MSVLQHMCAISSLFAIHWHDVCFKFSSVSLCVGMVGMVGMAGMIGMIGVAWANPPVPLTITADRLEVNDLEQTALFNGNVHAEQGEARLQADRMKIFYGEERRSPVKSRPGKEPGKEKEKRPPKENPKRDTQVREIQAEGRVVLQQSAVHGEGDRATYRMVDRTITLIGDKKDAWAQQGEDRLEGHQISVVLTKDQRLEKVLASGGSGTGNSGGSGRVSARLLPKSAELGTPSR